MTSRLPRFVIDAWRRDESEGDYGWPDLETGERVLADGIVELPGRLAVGALGRLRLTDRRLIWRQTRRGMIWPFRRIAGEVRLVDIARVDTGTLLDRILGGPRLRVRLRQGKHHCFFDVEGNRLGEWVDAIRRTAGRAPQT